ncbi:MAG: ankyrin repeat domain-containing protein [Treponema sp.]|nr:ankyrin repeat domain-containing protein [Treponema sp.]
MKIRKLLFSILLGVAVMESSSAKEKNYDQDLLLACKDGNRTKVETLLGYGASPYATVSINGKEYNALALACKHESIELVKLLVFSGTPINVGTEVGKVSPLAEAAKTGNISIVDFLLDNGANPNGRDEEESTALMNIIKMQDNGLFSKALKYGNISVNLQNQAGHTAVSYAVKTGDPTMLESLVGENKQISQAANLNIYISSEGCSLFQYAMKCQNTDAMRLFIKEDANVLKRDRKGRTPLLWGIKNNCPTERLQTLLTMEPMCVLDIDDEGHGVDYYLKISNRNDKDKNELRTIIEKAKERISD